jgi:hypothetical protein
MKNRRRGNRERRLRQFAGVERRPANLLNARAYWRLRESSERPPCGDPSGDSPFGLNQFWRRIDNVLIPLRCVPVDLAAK